MTPWNYLDYLIEQALRIEDKNECGVSEDHAWKDGDIECRRCGADLSEWNEEGEDDE